MRDRSKNSLFLESAGIMLPDYTYYPILYEADADADADDADDDSDTAAGVAAAKAAAAVTTAGPPNGTNATNGT